MTRQIDLRGLEGARRLMMVAAGASDDRVREQLELRSTVVFMKAIGMCHLKHPHEVKDGLAAKDQAGEQDDQHQPHAG